jgi:multicomponent Na+:H+ antiporter subunit G
VSAEQLIAAGLLALGVALEGLAVAGVLLMRDAYDRLHFLGPATLGALPLGAAVAVRAGPSLIALKALVVVAVLVVSSPLFAHALARAARLAEHGDWRRRQSEPVEPEAG